MSLIDSIAFNSPIPKLDWYHSADSFLKDRKLPLSMVLEVVKPSCKPFLCEACQDTGYIRAEHIEPNGDLCTDDESCYDCPGEVPQALLEQWALENYYLDLEEVA